MYRSSEKLGDGPGRSLRAIEEMERERFRKTVKKSLSGGDEIRTNETIRSATIHKSIDWA
jgi:hypothetical protein